MNYKKCYCSTYQCEEKAHELVNQVYRNIELVKPLSCPGIISVQVQFKGTIVLSCSEICKISKQVNILDFMRWFDENIDILNCVSLRNRKRLIKILLKAYNDRKYKEWLISKRDARRARAKTAAVTRHIREKLFWRLTHIEPELMLLKMQDKRILLYKYRLFNYALFVVRKNRIIFFESLIPVVLRVVAGEIIGCNGFRDYKFEKKGNLYYYGSLEVLHAVVKKLMNKVDFPLKRFLWEVIL